ncbi:MAG: hypothetical protein E7258_01000 [Lachnospiraceae bacterium]|nr:hypothetical protein [Lachnospiraceae bacterium]
MESRRVLKELYIGILICTAIFLVIGCIFMRPIWIYALGILVGGAGACAQAYGIYDTLDLILSMDPKSAKGKATLKSITRILICLILMTVAIVLHWAAFVGVTIGLLTLKFSAMINPFIRKHITKIDGVDNTLDIQQK